MRLVFHTLPLPAAARQPDGKNVNGAIHFEAKAFDADERDTIDWPNQRPLPTARQWLAQVTGEGAVVIAPPPGFETLPAVGVPASTLRALSPETRVAMEFWWEATK